MHYDLVEPDPRDYRPTYDEALASLTRKAKELLDRRDPLELFDVRGLPKPSVRMVDGGWARNPLAALHSIGISQARESGEWRDYLHEQFPAREDILEHRRAERERQLRLALASNLLSVRHTKVVTAELREIEQFKAAA
jgi:hypothetical protein